jgi:translocator protein
MNNPSSIKPGWSLLILLAIMAAVATLAAAASINAQVFYAELVKPAWAPPAGIFGPVWTVLYLMMTFAAWLVVRARGWQASRLELGVYFSQLALNALWSWLFFAWRVGNFALLDVVVLWLAIVVTIILFWRVQRWAGVLLIPYLLWVSFATLLTYTVCKLNPDLL